MTPKEFKAWFDGFTEAFDRLPTKAQWTRIKERVAEIDGRETTERVFVERYWPYSIYNGAIYSQPARWVTIGGIGQVSNGGYQNNVDHTGTNYSSTSAMFALGKTDALTLTA